MPVQSSVKVYALAQCLHIDLCDAVMSTQIKWLWMKNIFLKLEEKCVFETTHSTKKTINTDKMWNRKKKHTRKFGAYFVTSIHSLRIHSTRTVYADAGFDTWQRSKSDEYTSVERSRRRYTEPHTSRVHIFITIILTIMRQRCDREMFEIRMIQTKNLKKKNENWFGSCIRWLFGWFVLCYVFICAFSWLKHVPCRLSTVGCMCVCCVYYCLSATCAFYTFIYFTFESFGWVALSL